MLAAVMLLASLEPSPAHGAEVIPPPPPRHFNDYAGVIDPAVATSLDQKLAAFEKETSNQLVVAMYARMQSDSSIEDYTVRVAEKWGVGQKQRDNGIVLFVFTQDRQMYIQVGYGLEGALPDALAKNIIETQITPRFRQGDYAGGLSAGIDAIMAATRGEYKAMPVPRRDSRGGGPSVNWFFIALVILIILVNIFQRSGPSTYSRRGRRGGRGPMIFFPPGGGRGGFGGFGGRGGFGGGGGFRGGGGSFGGGGAGGRW